MSVKIYEQNKKDHSFTTFKRPDKSSGILECHSHSIVQVLNHFVVFANRLEYQKLWVKTVILMLASGIPYFT